LTGPITVTAPGGTATSETAFIVGDPPGTPTITSFAPTIGTPGTTVAITGTNFDTLAANNAAIFNTNVRRSFVVSSATPTQFVTAVPTNVASGRITVATRKGQGLSAQDFFVPPAPYTAANVGVARRLAIGDITTVTLATN